MVTTRGSTAEPSKAQPPPPDLIQMIQQQSQLLKQMEQRLANLEATPTSANPTTVTTPVDITPGSYQFIKDPCERIKTAEVPKFDGKKEVEAWVIRFKKYCRLIKLTEDSDILTAMGIAMEEKAALWWEHAEDGITSWEAARTALLRTYGDPRKQKDSANRLKKLPQGSMTISEYFMEIENLNIYAQLNPETLPTFLEPGLNDDLRKRMEIMQSLQPVEAYSEWKKRALEQGIYLEAGKRKNVDRKKDGIKLTEDTEGKNQLVSREEKDRRIVAGECIKCGRQGHIAKNCRKGWISTELGEKRVASGSNELPRNPKRQLITQPDGCIRSISSYMEPEDSGKE